MVLEASRELKAFFHSQNTGIHESLQWALQALEDCLRSDLPLPQFEQETGRFVCHIFEEPEFEESAMKLLKGNSLIDLAKLLTEIESTLRVDASTWPHSAYWHRVMVSAKVEVATRVLEGNFLRFVLSNPDKI